MEEQNCTLFSSAQADLSIKSKKIIWQVLLFFWLVQINLVLLDVVVNYNKLIDYQPIRKLFNMEFEDSLANWISSVTYLSVALAAWAITLKERYLVKRKFSTLVWAVIALGFTYLAADDGAGIHERVGTTLKLFHDRNSWNPEYYQFSWVMKNFQSYYWQIVFVPILAFFAIGSFIYFWRTFNSTKLVFLVALAFTVMAIAQGLDYLEGINYNFIFIQDLFDLEYKTVRHYFKVFEEFLEMFGMTILLGVFLEHFFSGMKHISLQFCNDRTIHTEIQK